jgi:selenium metabolism protein YedF
VVNFNLFINLRREAIGMKDSDRDLECKGEKVKKGFRRLLGISTKGNILLVISTDTIGEEEEIGRILMKGFLETMKTTKELPHTIFFINTGIKLTTVNEETIPILKEIGSLGVEIFSCGTCLKYYNLEDKLKVGYRGTTNHIVEGMNDFKKTVWI